jgi:long-subunit fatty acid transport protein
MEDRTMKTTRISIAAACLAASCLLGQSPEEAVNFIQDETGIGLRALAMGNAYAGVSDDYSALYWNPAGLALLESTEITAELDQLKFSDESSYSRNTIIENRTFTKLRSLGLAYKFPTSRGSLVVAFGFNRFKDYDNALRFEGFSGTGNGLEFDLDDGNGGTAAYAFDRGVRRSESLSESGRLDAWSLACGLAVSPNATLGVSAQWITGSSLYLFDFSQDDVGDAYTVYPADFADYSMHQEIRTDFSGWSMKIGGMFRMNSNLRLGLTADLPMTLGVSENYLENDVLTFDDGTVDAADLGSGEWEYLVRYPAKIGAGAGLDLGPLLLTGSMEYRDWTQVRFAMPGGSARSEDYDGLIADNVLFAERFRPVTSAGAGAELRIPGTGIALRGGWRTVPSPARDSDRTLDRRYVSAGIGFDAGPGASFNVSVVRGSWNRISSDSYTPDITEEAVRTTRILGGLTLRF